MIRYRGHCGLTNLVLRIKESFYNPKLVCKVKEMLKNCQVCKLNKNRNRVYHGPLVANHCTKILGRVYIDLMGPLVRSKNGNIGVLVAVDDTTKFTWCIPIKNMTTKHVIDSLEKYIFNNFGIFDTVVSDNGACFRSLEFRNFCFKKAMYHHRIAGYSASGNRSERYMQSLKLQLKSYFSHKQNMWDQNIGYIQLSINTCQNAATKQIPYDLMFGRKCNDELSNLWGLNDILDNQCTVEETNVKIEQAIKSLKQQNVKNSRGKYFCEKTGVPFVEGDIVYMKTHFLSNKGKGFSKKLANTFVGPYRICLFTTPVTCVVQNTKNLKDIRRTHIAQLKK